MKMLSCAVTGLGVLALILAALDHFAGHTVIVNVSPAGLIRGASALFLLALVIQTRGDCSSCKTPPEKP
jgi:hypothetical protein